MKQKLGKQVETLRKELGVSTYELEKLGVHPSLPSKIERGEKGYSIDSLLKYLNSINEVAKNKGETQFKARLSVLRG